MIVKASVRRVLISAIGLLVFLAGPSQAAPAPDADANSKQAKATSKILHRNLRHSWRHIKSYANREPHKMPPMGSADRKVAVAGITADEALLNIPPWVANANAQLQPVGTRGADSSASPQRTNDVAQDPDNARSDDATRVVAADQLNDVDRGLREDAMPAITANPPASPAATARGESSTWGQTSLIGKIFIGFGALLTMASAARMFIS
ncbi:MAG TPA: hypothetical protein VFK01_06640 [Bradyrhizobium sp.]|jgi:hypothetical protein|nr:hypothetical protein [Bradyrhizobium sp.]